MAWIKRYKKKKLISKISVDSNFMFSSYGWLCVFHCSHRLLCWIKSRIWDFSWKLLSFHTEIISTEFLWGSVLLRGELRKYAKNPNFENFESALYLTSGSMPLNSMLHFLWPILDLHPSQLQLRNNIDFLLTCGFAVVSNKTNWTVAIVIFITVIVMIGIVTYATILASRNAKSVTSVEFWSLACGKIVKIC